MQLRLTQNLTNICTSGGQKPPFFLSVCLYDGEEILGQVRGGMAMTIVHTVQGPRITVAVKGDLDLKTADPLRDALDRLIERYRDKHLILDLTEVDFVDSSGLGVILGRYRRLAGQGRTMALTGAKPAVRSVLDMAGIGSIMSVSDSVGRSPVRDGRL